MYTDRRKKEQEERENSIVLKVYSGVRNLIFGVTLAGSLVGMCQMSPEEKEFLKSTSSINNNNKKQVQYILTDEEEQQDEIEMTTPEGNVAKVRLR